MTKHRICTIPDCGRKHKARGFCLLHYERFKQHGDPLFTLTAANGEPARFLAEALSYTGDDCLNWPFNRSQKGYAQIWQDGRQTLAARRVCLLAHGPPPTPEHEAAHSCGNGHDGCIAPGHLRWATHAENIADKQLHKLRRI